MIALTSIAPVVNFTQPSRVHSSNYAFDEGNQLR